MTRIKSLKGFTLIELIVVVIIIGVLAAIAAVAYNQFVAQARKTAAVANAKQVVTAVAAFGQSNDLNAQAVLTGDAGGDPDVADRDELGLSEGIFISDVTNDSVDATKKVVTVYSGKDDSAKHFCELDVTGDIPNLKMATCK